MAKLTKRVVESLDSDGSKHGTLYWDTELKGFGVRVFSTGLKTFVVKFRTRSGRQRWLKIGAFGAMTAEQARDRAMVELAKVINGEDPADDRDQPCAAVSRATYWRARCPGGAGVGSGEFGTPLRVIPEGTPRPHLFS